MKPVRAIRSRVAPQVLRRAGAAFLAGPALDDALATARRLDAAGIGVSLAYWDGPEDTPATIEEQLLAAVEAAGRLSGRARVSVKVPPLEFDEAVVSRLARRAQEAGVGLVLDAHAPEQAEDTLALARTAADQGADTGVALPARWRRSRADASRALEQGLRVRVVKGQWRDDGADAPVGERTMRQEFLDLVEHLPGPADRVGVATHDGRLLAELTVPSRRRSFGELELLLGLPSRRVLAAAARAAVPVRYYLPFGHASIGFDAREMGRRPRLGIALAEGVLLGRANQRLRSSELARSGVGSPGRTAP